MSKATGQCVCDDCWARDNSTEGEKMARRKNSGVEFEDVVHAVRQAVAETADGEILSERIDEAEVPSVALMHLTLDGCEYVFTLVPTQL